MSEVVYIGKVYSGVDVADLTGCTHFKNLPWLSATDVNVCIHDAGTPWY